MKYFYIQLDYFYIQKYLYSSIHIYTYRNKNNDFDILHELYIINIEKQIMAIHNFYLCVHKI